MRILFTLTILLSLLVAANSQASSDQVVPETCQSNRVKLQMLGTRGPEILDGQASTGYLIWLDNHARIIVDQGPGSLQRFEQSRARYEDVQLMLFTHFHADHSADFPSYIKGGFFTERNRDLPIYGPSGNSLVSSADEFVTRAIGSKTGMYPYLGVFLDPQAQSSYKLKVHTIAWSYRNLDIKEIYHQDGIRVKTVPVHHGPFPALGYRIELAGCVISFSGDMSGRLNAMPGLAKNSDILVAHNAIPENATGVPARLHMKPSYIGKMAQQANVKKLLLTHLMKRSLSVKAQTLKLIRKSYGGEIVFAKDLDIFRP